jgi:hypothetical protein
MGDETVDAVARSQIEGLIAKVDQHRAESQSAHGATATALTSQSIVLARMEERQAAESEARKLAESKAEASALTPQKIAAIVGGVGSLIAALGYGAPKAIEAAQASAHQSHVEASAQP